LVKIIQLKNIEQKMSEKPTYSKGLAGVIAGETSISTVGKEGLGLSYRGYSITDLCNNSNFEEVSYLLINGELPSKKQLKDFYEEIHNFRIIPENLKKILELLPSNAQGMDVLRTCCSVLGSMEPEAKKFSDPKEKFSQWKVGIRLMSIFGPCLLYWYHFHQSGIKIETQTKKTDSIAMNFCRFDFFFEIKPKVSFTMTEKNQMKILFVQWMFH
jgi:2-methylcitrate synthase